MKSVLLPAMLSLHTALADENSTDDDVCHKPLNDVTFSLFIHIIILTNIPF